MYQVSLRQFTGPLDLLLHLVEEKNLEITEISLSKITQDYLDYISQQNEIAPGDLADFLVVASTLLLIKSKSLLPNLQLTPEEEEEVRSLEERLVIFKQFKEKSQWIMHTYQKHTYLFSRPPWSGVRSVFLPPQKFDLLSLPFYYRNITKDLLSPRETIEEKKIRRVVSLKSRIKDLINRLTQGKKYNFGELVADKKDKIELIVTFLAVLHLVRDNLIEIQQKKNFDTIWISST